MTSLRRDPNHRIADISYVPGVPDREAPMTCLCGWQGLYQDFVGHRTGWGPEQKRANLGSGRLAMQVATAALPPEERTARILRGARRTVT